MKHYTQKTIEFYNDHVKEYFESGGVVLRNKISKFIKLLPGGRVLDVACGPGHDTDYLTKKGLDCLGIDLSKNMIEFARKNHKGKFEIADFVELDFRKNSFDGIWCSSALTHIDKSDLLEILLGFKKILRMGGILAIIVPQIRRRIQNKNDDRIFTMFDKEELESYLIDSDFKILRSENFSSKKMKWIFILSKNN